MKKLRLDPETLHVESFASDDRAALARGTVDAHSFVSKEWGPCSGPGSQDCPPTAYQLNTCGVSCQNDCFPSDFCSG